MNSLHRLLNCEIGGLDCRVLTPILQCIGPCYLFRSFRSIYVYNHSSMFMDFAGELYHHSSMFVDFAGELYNHSSKFVDFAGELYNHSSMFVDFAGEL